ncbi:hypothetical protein [uncultured Methanobrevibacter sp.]|uniref:hypothetical protein n=1 Tax=uncultured Methanobrevibacter sp. TaxID=253161 RepID=UPI00262F4886|nr:hypothetical protein [uncultured Methanobrevibacter sp.]
MLLVIAIPVVSAEENTTTIDNSITIGPDNSIQNAVNNANANDIIYLTLGTYYQEGIQVNKNLTFQGKGNAEDIIINGQFKNSIIEINSVSTVKFLNITFINGNSPSHGGAIHGEKGGSIYITNCIFKNNKADQNGGAVSVAGAEPYYKYGKKIIEKGYLSINNCQFIDNYAGHDGGAINTYRGDTNIYNSIFRYNYAYRDGGATRTGIYSTTNVEGCIFENNTAKEWGGALYNWPGELTVKNCTIANNTAGTKGAAIITSGPLKVIKSIIKNNYGKYGAIYVDEETPEIPSRVIFRDNIITDNYIENNVIFYFERTTAKNSIIDNNYFKTNNISEIILDKSGLIKSPTGKPYNPNPTPTTPKHPTNENNTITNTTNPTNDMTNTTQTTENTLTNIISEIANEINKFTSNANKVVSNSTESNNINVGTDIPQEPSKSSDSKQSVHELLDNDVSKQTQNNIIPYIIILIIVFAVLIFGYYRYRKNE